MRGWLRTVARPVSLIALLGSVLAASYCGYVAVRGMQPIELPVPGGSYPVGRSTYEWTDASRFDPLSPHRGTPRQLAVWLWYPAVGQVRTSKRCAQQLSTTARYDRYGTLRPHEEARDCPRCSLTP